MNLLTPVTQLGACVLAPQAPGTFALTKAQRAVVSLVQTGYSRPLALEDYQTIPASLPQYLQLMAALQATGNALAKTNPDAALLLQITENALQGAINALSLNAANVHLGAENAYLDQVIQDLLAGKNVLSVFQNTEGTLTMQQGFDLAPLFQYYIQQYGMPAIGAGFDLTLLRGVYDDLIALGIDPGVPDFTAIPAASQCAYDAQVVDMYTRLAKYIDAIQTLNAEYQAGHFEIVASLLTQGVYEELAKDLLELKYVNPGTGPLRSQFQTYEDIRLGVSHLLGGLYQAVLQYGILQTTQTKLVSVSILADILLDPVKLKKYIEENYTNRFRAKEIFQPLVITAKKATLKPQYAAYIERHGYPEGGVFELDKLGVILAELALQNIDTTAPDLVRAKQTPK
jgi:hypothetical protein